MKIVLASGSPRRREILEMLRVEPLEILPAKGEERADPTLDPEALVKALSAAKAAEVARLRPDALVIGADTVVAVDGQVLGKPKDAADAGHMLRLLSGRSHSVYTGVSVFYNGVPHTQSEHTRVRFRPLSEAEIAAYIATGEPMDKAGAYGAQGIGGLFVEGIEGDFFNVMGLPLCRLGIMLKELGVNLI